MSCISLLDFFLNLKSINNLLSAAAYLLAFGERRIRREESEADRGREGEHSMGAHWRVLCDFHAFVCVLALWLAFPWGTYQLGRCLTHPEQQASRGIHHGEWNLGKQIFFSNRHYFDSYQRHLF